MALGPAPARYKQREVARFLSSVHHGCSKAGEVKVRRVDGQQQQQQQQREEEGRWIVLVKHYMSLH